MQSAQFNDESLSLRRVNSINVCFISLPFADEAALSKVYLKVIALSILINVGLVR